jgi:hypothetical protein
MNPVTYPASQAELEARAVQLSFVADLKACKNLREAFGSADRWQLAVGPYRFRQIPFLREWWWYDTAHKEGRYTGPGPGKIRFLIDGDGLRLEKVPTSRDPEPSPAGAAGRAKIRRAPFLSVVRRSGRSGVGILPSLRRGTAAQRPGLIRFSGGTLGRTLP